MGVPDIGAARCAAWSRANGLDPIGTAGSYQGYLLADVALPWPSDIADHHDVSAAASLLHGTGIRLQATVRNGAARAVLYRESSAGAAMTRQELGIAAGCGPSLADATEALLLGNGGAAPGPRREVIVCTHGHRDVCCGVRGSRLHSCLAASPDLLGDDVEVRRTSHTGGHRFAPTAVVLPEATAWAYLDVDVLAAVVSRSGPIGAVLGHYRGSATMGSPHLQALERAVLAEVGWELLDRRRRGEDLGSGRVRLHVEDAGEGGSLWEATVVEGRKVPRLVECGKDGTDTPDLVRGNLDTELLVQGLCCVSPG